MPNWIVAVGYLAFLAAGVCGGIALIDYVTKKIRG